MGSFNTQQSSGILWRPEKQYLTVRETATVLGLSDDYVRDLVKMLLDKEELMPSVDVLEVRRLDGGGGAGRHYRQFRIHKETGLGKLKVFLTPESSRPIGSDKEDALR